MARLFPFRSEPATRDGQPRVVDLEGEDADAVFSALSSTTAREIYARLDDEPGTPSDVADAIDSSIQNVRYHLEKLEGAGLVEVVDTWYSSRGNEMSVYATTDGPLIVTSDESTASQLKTALSRLIGGIGALAGGSLLVQYGLTRQFGFAGTDDAAPAGDEADSPATDDGEDQYAMDEDDDRDGADEPTEEPTDDDLTADSVEDDDADAPEEEPEEAEEAAPEDDPATATDDSDDADYDTDDADYESGENVSDAPGENLSDGGAEAAETVLGTVPPGLLFFLGGLVVLLAVTAYWYWYRPAY